MQRILEDIKIQAERGGAGIGGQGRGGGGSTAAVVAGGRSFRAVKTKTTTKMTTVGR